MNEITSDIMYNKMYYYKKLIYLLLRINENLENNYRIKIFKEIIHVIFRSN